MQHLRPHLRGQHFVCVADHAALRYFYSMQDTSNMVTRWAIALQYYDFTVQHMPGKLHVVPDTPSRMLAFEHQQEIALPSLAPICRNVPDDPNFFKQRTRPAHIRFPLQKTGRFKMTAGRQRALECEISLYERDERFHVSRPRKTSLSTSRKVWTVNRLHPQRRCTIT